MLLRTGALRGRVDLCGAPVAGRIASVTLLPFVLAFFGAGRFAGGLPLVLRRRSLSSSSSGSPSVLASSSSELASSASTPLSGSSPRFRLLAPVGLAPGVNFWGFFVTRPDFRRELDEGASPASDAATAALMLLARDAWIGWAQRWLRARQRRVKSMAAAMLLGGDLPSLVRVNPRTIKVWR